MPSYTAMSTESVTTKIRPFIQNPKSFVAINKTTLGIKTTAGKTIPLEMNDSELKNFLPEFIQSWARTNAGAAKKALFDYFSNDNTFLKVLFVLNLLLHGGAAAIFLSDGLQNIRCNQLLTQPTLSQSATAQITKVKKDRRGNFNWDLTFLTTEGKQISGRRTAVNPDAAITYETKTLKKAAPVGSTSFTTNNKMNATEQSAVSVEMTTTETIPTSALVVYAPQNLKCWDVSIDSKTAKLPYGHRWFVAQFTIGFGSFFGLVCFAITVFLYTRIRRVHPHKELLEAIYQKLT